MQDRAYPDSRYPYADPRYPERPYHDREYAPPGYSGRPDPDYDGDEPGPRASGAQGHEPEAGGRGFEKPPPPRGSHLPPYLEPNPAAGVEAGIPAAATTPDPNLATGGRSPRKLTVTRVAALRGRELTNRGVQAFHRATTADGADKSGLTALTYAVMGNYAIDAAVAVALANTIFFADTGSTGKVLAYLVITVAPFAVIAPFIGPMLDRLQHGRRLALAVSSFVRALLCFLMVFNFSPFNPWVIYPCALGNLVMSKAFSVLKAALTPRVLPEQITLVKTNSRLTVFGLLAAGVAGTIAAGFLKVAGSQGALVFTTIIAVGGGILCLRIPAWVESTEGEVPVNRVSTEGKKGFPPSVLTTLWANSTIRIETGFLALFIAFVVKYHYSQHSGFTQLLLLGIVGASAAVGGFVGNALGARLNLSKPEMLSILCLAVVTASCLLAAVISGLGMAALVGFVGSTGSSLAKVCLDSVIQHQLPEASRASAFGKSESILQLAWVFGGVIGLLIGGVWFSNSSAVYAIGFGTVTALLTAGLAQSYTVHKGKTLLPGLKVRGPKGRTGRARSGKGQTPGAQAGYAPAAGAPIGGYPYGDGTTHLAAPPPAAGAPAGAVTSGASKPKRRIRKAGSNR